MESLLSQLKFIPVLIAAVIVGNLFLKEVKKAKATGAPWYAPYLSVPGLIVLIALSMPILLRLLTS
jgi:hypothetical protein